VETHADFPSLNCNMLLFSTAETFCFGDVLLQETFCYGDILWRRRFVWRRFVEEAFCAETFCMCAKYLNTPMPQIFAVTLNRNKVRGWAVGCRMSIHWMRLQRLRNRHLYSTRLDIDINYKIKQFITLLVQIQNNLNRIESNKNK
jgi:hypothetical protein